jgi:hypothetical protein
VLTRRVLNRTLLQRQHLLARTSMPILAMVEHLLGLQAQDPLPPYLSLRARIAGFDPLELSGHLERREAVRLMLMRGTVHLVSPADALGLRPLVQGVLDQVTRNSAVSREAGHLPRAELAAAGRTVLAGGPLTVTDLGVALAAQFPGVPPTALASSVREMLPLVQLPPRGLWRRSGGVVYDRLESWVGATLSPDPDFGQVARRYLRAFGPARPADLTTWSGVTGMKAVIDALGDELVTYRDEDGRVLFDLDGLPLADADTPAPVRLLGKYDNLWLSHAGRDRVTGAEQRSRWMGPNGGTGNTIFVDGQLAGLWTQVGDRIEVELFGRLSRAQQDELDAEVAEVEAFLAR